jgi:hypothetical protein
MVVSEQSALKVGETSNLRKKILINSTLKVRKQQVLAPFPPTQNKRKILVRSGQKRKIFQELVVAQPTTTAVVAEERQSKTAKLIRDSALLCAHANFGQISIKKEEENTVRGPASITSIEVEYSKE